MNRPNILFIMTDQQRHDALGSVQSLVQTPNLDRLAREGVRFTKAYCTNPSCVPSRAAMATGAWPSQCGAPTFITYAFDHWKTTAQRLREAGYTTFVTGKQHWGSSRIERGYDLEWPVVLLERGEDPANHPDELYSRLLAAQGIRSLDDVIRQVPGAPATYEWIADPALHPDIFAGELAVRWMRNERPMDRPWYAEVSFHGPHTPYDGLGLPEAALYNRADIPLPENSHEDWGGKPPHWSKYPGFTRTPWHKEALTDPARRNDAIRAMRHSYWANVTAIDRQIGRILDLLRETGAYDNTLILFTSDHGDFQGEFSLPAKAQYLAEALVRVPLIVKPPVTGYSGRVIADHFASTIDLAPTMLSAAGLPIPDEVVGRDLSGWWRPDAKPVIQDDAYMEAQGLRALRYKQWKLVHYRGRAYGELYNLDADPAERINLWDDPAFGDTRHDLTRRLVDRMIAITPRSDIVWNKNNPEI